MNWWPTMFNITREQLSTNYYSSLSQKNVYQALNTLVSKNGVIPFKADEFTSEAIEQAEQDFNNNTSFAQTKKIAGDLL